MYMQMIVHADAGSASLGTYCCAGADPNSDKTCVPYRGTCHIHMYAYTYNTHVHADNCTCKCLPSKG